MNRQTVWAVVFSYTTALKSLPAHEARARSIADALNKAKRTKEWRAVEWEIDPKRSNHKLDCGGESSFHYVGEGPDRVRVCSCGAKDELHEITN